MSEWWTYRLSSFLLFSSQTYYRLFELYNAAIWPAQVLAIVLGLTILVLLFRAAPIRSRAIAAILAACWLFVAVAFQARRYATINWAAVYFAWTFGIEAVLLILTSVFGRLRFERPADLAGRAGMAIFLFALVVSPLVGPALGRGWRGIELFGVAPDPTAVATLGILLLARGRGRWLLMVIPALWCVITGATLLAMNSPDAWIPPLAAVLAVSLAIWQSRLPRRPVIASAKSFHKHKEDSMRTRNVLAFAVSFVLATVALAQASGAAKAKPASKAVVKKAVIMPAADLKWTDLDPTAPGVRIADLWGDHTKGAFGAFNKFPAGWSAPLHTHTHDMKLVVVSGTWIHTPEGKPEVRLGPGSYMMQPGNYRHASACDKASECVCFIESNGAFDMFPAK